ncbi:D-alanyl-D-alanine carboxypeptidase family protein [Shouchella shacheensis]|uniref:D-alanyl-D-alanine carboxypeptidase family protein n=1 Tax=Shouchella shacheensis TaxID=1649580 RepID=UPI00074046F1|nr:D-alanyl-D-alanine carboxypeptidase family protein [Shouchella shacheensis]
MKKIWIGFWVFLLFFASVTPHAFAEEEKKPGDALNLAEKASSAIVIERDTGEVLFEKDSDKSFPPASMTKIMTMLLIMEAIDEERLAYDDMVRVSERAASMGGSQVFLEPGEEMTVEDMLKAIAVASGNDAAVAMAEHIAGSEDEFINRMNEKAKELGLEHTEFHNSNGLPVADHYTSAHDLAVMSKELLKYEEITQYTGIYEDYLRKGTDNEFWLVNTNKLVKFYPGVDGLKTGYTSEAKYGLTATAEKDGMRVIAVVMGAPTPKERNAQITAMLDYSFSQYSTTQMHERGEVIQDVNVAKGEKDHVQAVVSEKVSILTKKGMKVDDATVKADVNEQLQAPVKQNEVIGKLVVENDGDVLSETDLVAGEDVGEASWWTLVKRMMTKFGG